MVWGSSGGYAFGRYAALSSQVIVNPRAKSVDGYLLENGVSQFSAQLPKEFERLSSFKSLLLLGLSLLILELSESLSENGFLLQ